MASSAEQAGGGLIAAMRREWRLFLLLTVSALVAIAAGLPWYWVALVWLILVLAVSARPPVVMPVAELEKFEEEEQASDPLPSIAATLSALDIPVLLLNAEAIVLWENKAAEKALGLLPIGSHLSARLRSPGILDMVKETIATGVRKNSSSCRSRIFPNFAGLIACGPISSPMPAMNCAPRLPRCAGSSRPCRGRRALMMPPRNDFSASCWINRPA